MTGPAHTALSQPLGGRPFGALALVAASIFWGTTGTAASFFPDSVSPLAIGASTMSIGGLLLFAVAPRSSLAALRDSRSRPWLLIGAIGVVTYALAFYSSMDAAGVAVGNVVALGSGPVFAAIFERVFERARLSLRWLTSTLIAVAGVITLGIGGRADAAAGDGRVGGGILLGLIAGLAYALYTYSSTRAIRVGHSGRSVMGGMFGIGAVALAPVLILTGTPLAQSFSTVSIAVYLAVVPMFVAYLLFGFGLVRLRSSAATTITLLEPFVATVLAVIVVGERLSVLGWVGLGLILVGVTVLATAREYDESPNSP